MPVRIPRAPIVWISSHSRLCKNGSKKRDRKKGKENGPQVFKIQRPKKVVPGKYICKIFDIRTELDILTIHFWKARQ